MMDYAKRHHWEKRHFPKSGTQPIPNDLPAVPVHTTIEHSYENGERLDGHPYALRGTCKKHFSSNWKNMESDAYDDRRPSRGGVSSPLHSEPRISRKKLLLLEPSPLKQQAQKRHFPSLSNSRSLERLSFSPKVPSSSAQYRPQSSNEYTLEDVVGRTRKINFKQLHDSCGHRVDSIEYSKHFFKMGATVPAVSMHHGAAKSSFDFVSKDLKSKLLSERLQKEMANRRLDTASDARKNKSYLELEKERRLEEDVKSVNLLPDDVMSGVETLEEPLPVHTQNHDNVSRAHSKNENRANTKNNAVKGRK